MKIRGLFKKAAATLMAAVTALSILPATTAFAAGDIEPLLYRADHRQGAGHHRAGDQNVR